MAFPYLYATKIADAKYQNGEYDEALKLYKESLAMARKSENQFGITSALKGIVNVDYKKREYDEAINICNEILDTARNSGDKLSLSWALGTIGNLFIIKRSHDKALVYTLEAYKIYEELHHPNAIIAINDLSLSVRN